MAQIARHLHRFPPQPTQPWRPAVTLTYAQSLDGCIAAVRGAPTRLSGDDSMLLTHELRARHDAILVGVGTVLADDPQLSTRLVPGHSPRPIVLDSNLRTPLSARLLRDSNGVPRSAIVVCSPERMSSERAAALTAAGAFVLPVARHADEHASAARAPANSRLECSAPPPAGAPCLPGRLELRAVLCALAACSVRTLMVEGGGHVLRSFIAEPELFDALCVTIAPTLLAGGPRFGEPTGDGASLTSLSPRARLDLEHVSYAQLGADVVLFATPARPRQSTAEGAA